MNGNCQGASKSAVLFQDPSLGPELSAQENKYLIQHWDFFKESIAFPHTVIVGGGKSIVFNDEKQFHNYIIQSSSSANYKVDDSLSLI